MDKGNRLPDIEETKVGAYALLIDESGRVILQQRDLNPNIVNPGLISMFGGSIKKGEDLETGLKRELREELGDVLDGSVPEKLGTYIKTKKVDGVDHEANAFVIRGVNLKRLKLSEGSGFVIGTPRELLGNEKLTRITRLVMSDFDDRF